MEIRAAGASILRKLSTSAAVAVGGAIASCHALLDSLDACRSLPEAIDLLSSFDLFGDDAPFDAGGGGGGGDVDGIGDGSGGDSGKVLNWRRQCRADAMVVLMALVASVNAASAGPSSSSAAKGIDGRRRGGCGGGGGGTGNGGGGAAAGADHNRNGFDAEESQALSAVCKNALRALVSRADCRIFLWYKIV